MYESTTRPLTPEEYERARQRRLEERQAERAGPRWAGGVLVGCFFMWAVVAAVVAFLVGGMLGLAAAAVTHNLDQAARFVLWPGGVAAGLAILALLRDQVRQLRRAYREGRELHEGAPDLGLASDIRCEIDGVACVAHADEQEPDVWFLSVGDGRLLVLRGGYTDGLRAAHGFPHRTFHLVLEASQHVSSYEGEGDAPPVRQIEYESLSDEEASALWDVADQSVIHGTIETCVADLTEHHRVWRL